MKEAFAQYLERNPEVQAIFVGTRRTDPHGGMLSGEGFDMTDGGWPRFMRVHPVIEWHYVEVWAVSYPLSHGQTKEIIRIHSLAKTGISSKAR